MTILSSLEGGTLFSAKNALFVRPNMNRQLIRKRKKKDHEHVATRFHFLVFFSSKPLTYTYALQEAQDRSNKGGA